MLRNTNRKQLRKQPKRYRTHSSAAVNFPRLNVPKTAKKRRRRQKTERFRTGIALLKRFFFTSRWISLGLLALTIFALVITVQESRFYLTYIPVEGAITFQPEEIVAASGLAGVHIFAADPSKAAEEIAALPGIVSSTVSLNWPNQVYIQITEDAPVAIWLEHGLAYGITSGGRLIPAGFPTTGLLQIIPETNPYTPIETVISEEDLVAEEGTNTEEESIVAEGEPINEEIAEEALSTQADNDNLDEIAVNDNTDGELAPSLAFVPQEVLHGALHLRELRPAISELYYRPSDGLSYQDDRGWRVYLGTGTDMNQKLVLYETIVQDLQVRGISPIYISVSNKSKPYYLAQ